MGSWGDIKTGDQGKYRDVFAKQKVPERAQIGKVASGAIIHHRKKEKAEKETKK